MKEITIADKAICDFIKSHCYTKMSKWKALVDMYGADTLQQKIEEGIQEIKIDPQTHIDGIAYIRKGDNSIYVCMQPEECTLENLQNKEEWLQHITHEMLHKIWEGDNHIACHTINRNGQALGEGLTQWGVQKLYNQPLSKDAYQRYTVLIEVMERFLGEDAVLQLSQNNRKPLEQVVGKPNVDLFLTYLDTQLQLHRANKRREQLSKILTKLIAFMEVGLDDAEDMKEFYQLQKQVYACPAYAQRKFLTTQEEGTLEFYKHFHDEIVRMHTETKLQEDIAYKQAIIFITNRLLQKRFEELPTHKTRNVQEFQKLAKSVAELTIASQQEVWKRTQPIPLYTIQTEKTLQDPLGDLRENMATLHTQWEKDILEDIEKHSRKPKKLANSISEMSAIMYDVQWKANDENWRLGVAQAMGIEPEKQEQVAILLMVAENQEDLENYRTYTMQSFQNGETIVKKQGKPFVFIQQGKPSAVIHKIENIESDIENLTPNPEEQIVYRKNFEDFKKLAMSRQDDIQIQYADGRIVLEHADHTYEYYRFNNQGQVEMLLLDLEKGEVCANGKQKKPTIKEKMHQWIQKRFTSKTSVRLLAEGKKQNQPQPELSFSDNRQTFVEGLKAKVQGVSEKQLAKKAQKQLEKKEKEWLRGR